MPIYMLQLYGYNSLQCIIVIDIKSHDSKANSHSTDNEDNIQRGNEYFQLLDAQSASCDCILDVYEIYFR